MALALLISIVCLTGLEIAAVVAITIWGPHDQVATSVEVLIGMVGPILASLVALARGSDAHATAQQAQAKAEAVQQRVDQVAESGANGPAR